MKIIAISPIFVQFLLFWGLNNLKFDQKFISGIKTLKLDCFMCRKLIGLYFYAKFVP